MSGGTIDVTPTLGNYLVLDLGRGSPNSVGAFNQSGGLVDLRTGALQVGVAQATGTYTLSNDAVASLTTGTVYFGDGVGGSGTLIIHDNAVPAEPGKRRRRTVFSRQRPGHRHVIQDGAGSLVVLNAPAGFSLGSSAGGIGGTGTYDLSAGRLEVRGVGMILGADDQGTGIFNQTGGEFALAGGSLAFGLGSGTYNLDGGELQLGVANPLVALGGVHAFNFGDGTIRAMVDFSTALDFNMVGASTVNTFDGVAGHIVTMSGPMQGGGSLTKAGAGTLLTGGVFRSRELDIRLRVDCRRRLTNRTKRYAVVTVRDELIEGLPSRAPTSLKQLILKKAEEAVAVVSETMDRTEVEHVPAEAKAAEPTIWHNNLYQADNFIVDAEDHETVLNRTIRDVSERFIIHSTFISDVRSRVLLPALLQLLPKESLLILCGAKTM